MATPARVLKNRHVPRKAAPAMTMAARYDQATKAPPILKVSAPHGTARTRGVRCTASTATIVMTTSIPRVTMAMLK